METPPNDNLYAVQTPVVQPGTQLGEKRNPGNVTRGIETAIVEQPGLSNFSLRSVLPREEAHSCHTS